MSRQRREKRAAMQPARRAHLMSSAEIAAVRFLLTSANGRNRIARTRSQLAETIDTTEPQIAILKQNLATLDQLLAEDQ